MPAKPALSVNKATRAFAGAKGGFAAVLRNPRPDLHECQLSLLTVYTK